MKYAIVDNGYRAEPQKIHHEVMREVEMHSKISDVAIRKNLVQMMSDDQDLAWGYLLSNTTVMCPHHYERVTGLRYKSGAQWKSVELTHLKNIPCNRLDSIDVYKLSTAIPSSNVPLGIAPSSFAGILMAPSFLQIGGINVVEGLLQYRAESVKGDCGQVMIDGETGNIVGMHVAKQRCADKMGLGIPFTPELLSALEDFRR